jgi:hypothetical protein
MPLLPGDTLVSMERSGGHSIREKGCIGLALLFENSELGFDWSGSPKQLRGLMQSASIAPIDAANHLQTKITGQRVFADGCEATFHGGPHAAQIMQLLDALGADDFENAAEILKETPDIFQGEHDGASVPLNIHSALGNADAVRFLLRHGAEVNRVGQFDMSALHWGAVYGHSEVAKMLIAGGADPTTRNEFLLTPANLAQQNGHAELAELLAGPYGLKPGFTFLDILRPMGCVTDS